MLNSTWLETFTVLAEEGHFTRAAARLNMTQPGVSQHLRKLEHQLGHPLITKDGKRFTLTEAGEKLRDLGLSRRAQERALRDVIARDDPDAGELRIACSGSFAMLFYPRAIALMRGAPDLAMHVEATPQSRVLDGVLEGRFDLGIVAHDPRHPRIDARQFGREELCLLLPEGVKDPVSFDTLEMLGLVAHPDVATYADDLFSLNFPEEFTGADRLKLRTYVNQISQIPAPVAEGVGYTLLPRSGLAAFPQAARVKTASLPEPRYHELWAITRRGRAPSARLKRIMGIVEEIAATLG
ncbi:LysR family transcriptional regulator [Aliishimia ponticola]|uniref:LysR family transcriptional regulator n=1 Tax=Aliishimia ponticola TaxID=2499833 RepID=A0A4S4NAD3_9RHOB|nr:LysR family transcriptional regulator [Aliishimia ponticola]THH36276.1 LysR family transcriptional regulator [Aliishimia ponticola]